MKQLTFKIPKELRAGQAVYLFLFWLQETKQLDIFYLPNEEIMGFYKEWVQTIK